MAIANRPYLIGSKIFETYAIREETQNKKNKFRNRAYRFEGNEWWLVLTCIAQAADEVWGLPVLRINCGNLFACDLIARKVYVTGVRVYDIG